MDTADEVDADGECADGEQQSCADEYGVVYFAHRRSEEAAHHQRKAQQEADIETQFARRGCSFRCFRHRWAGNGIALIRNNNLCGW